MHAPHAPHQSWHPHRSIEAWDNTPETMVDVRDFHIIGTMYCSGCFKNQRGGIKTQLPPAPGAQQYLNDPERNGCTCEDERLEIEWLKPFEVRVEELRGAWESGGVRHGERGTVGTVDPRGNPGIFKRLGEEMGSSAKDQENLGDLSGD